MKVDKYGLNKVHSELLIIVNELAVPGTTSTFSSNNGVLTYLELDLTI